MSVVWVPPSRSCWQPLLLRIHRKRKATVASATMGELVGQGYEIKAAAPNGSRYVVFMQKDKSAYACEFVNTAQTQCRQIN
jgi:hypothetical protein